MKTIVAVVCAASVCVPLMAQAPDAAGKWEATFYTEGGTTPATMVLKKEGEKVTGTISSHLGDAPVTGTQKGGDLVLYIPADFGNGPVTVTLTGNLKDDVMTGVADIGGEMQLDWGAKRVPSAGSGQAPSTGSGEGTATGAETGSGPGATAVDVSGSWELAVATAVGDGNPTITLEQSGEKLTGRYSGQLGEAPLTGTLKGKDITFEFPVDVQGSRFTVVYTGTVDKDAMKGTVTLGQMGEGTFTGARRK